MMTSDNQKNLQCNWSKLDNYIDLKDLRNNEQKWCWKGTFYNNYNNI